MSLNGRPPENDSGARPGRAACWWYVAFAGVFLLALVLPAYYDRPLEQGPNPGGAVTVSGGEAFLQGFLAVVLSVAGLLDILLNRPAVEQGATYWLELGAAGWLANVALVGGFHQLVKGRRRAAGVLGLLGLLLGSTIPFLVQHEIGPLLVGYYLWMATFGLLALRGLVPAFGESLRACHARNHNASVTSAEVSVKG